MHTLIIKVESGVVVDVYSTDPAQVIVVDYDMIEGDETFERRMQKAVLTMPPDYCINPEDIEGLVTSLVAECIRPARRQVRQVVADSSPRTC